MSFLLIAIHVYKTYTQTAFNGAHTDELEFKFSTVNNIQHFKLLRRPCDDRLPYRPKLYGWSVKLIKRLHVRSILQPTLTQQRMNSIG